MEQKIQFTDDVFECLQQEIHVVRALRARAEEQKQALITFNMDALQTAMQKQAELSDQLRLLERRRIVFISQLLGISFSQASSLCMTDLIALADDAQRDKMRLMQNELRTLSSGLTQLNNLNRILTDRSRKFIQEAVGILTNGTPMYNRKI